jgi:diguanylate cyclase (GGDEF)-like protein
LSNLKLRTSLQDQAMSDGLTGLYNRRYMDEALVHELQRSRRDQRPVSLAMIDVDHFKRFNDQYGHDAGDAVLKAIGGVLMENIRGYDIACRYGGEELALILPGCDVADAESRVQQVRIAVERMMVRNGLVDLPTVTISVGVAHALGGSASTLIRRADEALYEAKRGGRNRVVVSQASSLSAVPSNPTDAGQNASGERVTS